MLFCLSVFCILVFCAGIALCHCQKNLIQFLIQTSILFYSTVCIMCIFLGLFLKCYCQETVLLFSACLFLIGVVLLLKQRHKLKNTNIHVHNTVLTSKFHLIAALLIGATCVLKCISVILLKVYDWDGIVYHLPNLVDYIQNGTVSLVEKSLWCNVYPKNIEMLNMFVLTFFPNKSFVTLPQFVIIFSGIPVVYAILRELGYQKQSCFLAAVLQGATPIYLAQTTTAYVDIALTVILFYALYFLLLYAKSPTWHHAMYFSLSTAFLAGIKYSAAGYAAVLFLAFVVLSIQHQNKRKIFPVLLLLISFGGIWYFCNLVYFHNPIAPFQVQIAGHTIFDGVSMTDTIMTSNTPEPLINKPTVTQWILSWLELPDNNLSGNFIENFLMIKQDERLGGFGISWLVWLLPMFFVFIIQKTKNKEWKRQDWIITVIPIVLFLITPESWWTRYVAFIVILGSAAYCYFDEKSKHQTFLRTLLVFFVLINCVSGSAFSTSRLLSVKNDPAQLPEFVKQIYSAINTDESLTIVDFRPPLPDGFFLSGDNSQNKYLWYSPNTPHCESTEGINAVQTEEEFDRVLQIRQPDIVLLYDNYFAPYLEYFQKYTNHYQLIKTFDNILVYQKQAY